MKGPLRHLLPPWRLGTSVKSASEPELDRLSEGSVIVEWCFAVLVIAGVFGEFFIALKNPPPNSDLARWGPVAADFAVGFGVAIELLASVVSHICQTELGRRSNDRLGELELEAGYAEERAAMLANQAAEANERAVQAQLELERLRKPRSIDQLAQARIADKVSRFAGTSFIFTVLASDPEAAALLEQLTATLELAAWKQLPWKDLQGNDVQLGYTLPGRPLCGFNNLIGLFVQADMGSERQYRLPVAALTSALLDEGLEAKAEIGAMPDKMDKTIIHIQIGKKPI